MKFARNIDGTRNPEYAILNAVAKIVNEGITDIFDKAYTMFNITSGDISPMDCLALEEAECTLASLICSGILSNEMQDHTYELGVELVDKET